MKNIYKIYLIALFISILSSNSYSQATRTWVSGVGDDANPCSRTAPCKTFQGAISKTAAGGEISVLDPGGYGSVTITKAMTIDGQGMLASIISTGSNGINVNAGVNDVIVIKNISIEGGATGGLNGIRFLAGKELHVENVTIQSMTTGVEVVVNQTGNTNLKIKNVMIQKATTGVTMKTSTGNNLRASIDNLTVTGTTTGIIVGDSTMAMVRNSTFDNNTTGIKLEKGGIGNFENSSASNNANGILCDGTVTISTARLSNMSIFNNSTKGVSISNGGTVISFGNNRLVGNPANDPMGVIAQQ